MSELKLKTQHENFDPEAKRDRLKIIRQDRKNVDHLEAYLKFNDRNHKILNLNAFGLAVQSPISLESGVKIENCEVFINGYQIATPHLVVTRSFVENNNNIVAFEVMGEPISMGRVDALETTHSIISEAQKSNEEFNLIPADFKGRVYEIKDTLEYYQDRINQLEKTLVHTDFKATSDFEDAVIKSMSEHFNRILPGKNKELSQLLVGLSQEQIKQCFDFFRKKLYHLIYQAPFADRTYNKPLGYAGDYEMMNIIYTGDKLGHSLFARCLSYYWVGQPAAQAVRNRANYLVRRISETCERLKNADRPIRMLSVACGPTMEWQKMISEVKKYNNLQIEIDLIDQDENALKHAHQRMKDLSIANKNNFKFNFMNKAIKNIISKGLDRTDYDLIYTAGLFDYFTDPVAQYAGHRLYDGLKNDGELIIGNFNIDNPNQLIMDLALDWHLIYRSEDDLHRLFGTFSKKMTIDKEDLNINLFARMNK